MICIITYQQNALAYHEIMSKWILAALIVVRTCIMLGSSHDHNVNVSTKKMTIVLPHSPKVIQICILFDVLNLAKWQNLQEYLIFFT